MIGAQLIANLGWLIAAFGLLGGVTALYATGHGDQSAASIFLASSSLMLFVAAALVLGFRGRGGGEPSRPRDGLAFVVLAWTVLPAFLAVPIAAIAEIGAIDAYYEAVSVLTTTGATGFASIDALPRALVLWRSLIEWSGGALTLVFAAAALDLSRASGEPGVFLLSAGLAKSSRLVAVAREILPVYAIVTIACIAALRAAGIPGFDAACLGLSSLATGGAMPRDGDIASYAIPLAAPILALAMAAGATSFLVLRAIRSRRATLVRDRRRIATAAAVAVAVVAILAAVYADVAGAQGRGLDAAIVEAAFTTVSLLSTSGLVHDSAIAVAAPVSIVAGLLIVGGAYGSTAGGIKIGRVARMLDDAFDELRRLVYPATVSSGARERGGAVESRRILWSYLTAYMITAGVVALALATAGVALTPALIGALAAISNAGPAVSYLPEAAAVPIGAWPVWTKSIVSAAMIVGRIEILAILSLLTPMFWRR